MVFGTDFRVFWYGGSNQFSGTPTTLLGPLPDSDSQTVKDNYSLEWSGTVTVPVTPSVSAYGRIGVGWINKTATSNCVGLCDLAGTARYIQTQDLTTTGLLVGLGANVALPPNAVLPGMSLQLDFTHISADSKPGSFGTPATVATSFNVGNSIDRVTFGFIIPIAIDPAISTHFF